MLREGTIIDGKYKIIKAIGQGGMGAVYLAMDNKLNKSWAIKEVIRKNDGADEIRIKSFYVEANLLRKLDHPSIPTIIDIINNDGKIYVVMSYIDGRSLKSVLKQYGKQSEKFVVKCAIKLCDILIYLHSRDNPVIYKDMKPDNIMLNTEGEIKLIDFGIASNYYDNNDELDIGKNLNLEEIQKHLKLGTRGFASPEQFDRNKKVDMRSDIYSLGATMYTLLTNQIMKLDNNEIPEMYSVREIEPEINLRLNEIIEKCTKIDPNERYQSCYELKYDLEHYLDSGIEHRKKQIKKLVKCSSILLSSILFLGIGLFGLAGINKEKHNNYNTALNEATNYISKSIAEKNFLDEVPKNIDIAINIDPERNEAYIKLLDYYVRMGQTQSGLDKMETYIDKNIGNLKKNNYILMTVARLYFNGSSNDSNFSIDYSKAAKYFSMVDEDEFKEAAYYKDLSLSLSQFGNTIDWTSVIEALGNFEKYNDSQEIDSVQIDNYISLSSVYISNKNYMIKNGVDPFEKSIENLEKAKENLEFLSDEKLTQKYNTDILRSIGNSYYLKAENVKDDVKSKNENYEKAIEKYNLLLNIVENKETKHELMFLIANINKSMENFDEAEKTYNEIISLYPEDIDAYSNYGVMLLVNMNNKDKAVQIYNLAKDINGASSNSNFISLEEKLKNAGVI
ncbi:MAG: serine/threonine-protein kinase [Clostridium sp.]|nr:serine/threonine-protein kinase [Clostridium sp.]